MSKNCDVALRRVGRPPFVAIRLHAEPVSDGKKLSGGFGETHEPQPCQTTARLFQPATVPVRYVAP